MIEDGDNTYYRVIMQTPPESHVNYIKGILNLSRKRQISAISGDGIDVDCRITPLAQNFNVPYSAIANINQVARNPPTAQFITKTAMDALCSLLTQREDRMDINLNAKREKVFRSLFVKSGAFEEARMLCNSPDEADKIKARSLIMGESATTSKLFSVFFPVPLELSGVVDGGQKASMIFWVMVHYDVPRGIVMVYDPSIPIRTMPADGSAAIIGADESIAKRKKDLMISLIKDVKKVVAILRFGEESPATPAAKFEMYHPLCTKLSVIHNSQVSGLAVMAVMCFALWDCAVFLRENDYLTFAENLSYWLAGSGRYPM